MLSFADSITEVLILFYDFLIHENAVHLVVTVLSHDPSILVLWRSILREGVLKMGLCLYLLIREIEPPSFREIVRTIFMIAISLVSL